jgi:hypothetical protein
MGDGGRGYQLDGVVAGWVVACGVFGAIVGVVTAP